MFVHTKSTKKKLVEGGVGFGSAFGVAAGAAAVLLVPTAAVVLAGGALLGFLTAAYGGVAREDIRKIKRLAIRSATAEDLERLQTRLMDFTSTAVPLADRLKISRKNPMAFRVIEDLREEGRVRHALDIVAIYPLTADAAQAVRAGNMRGADIRASHIARSFRRAEGLYISFAEGSTPHTRGLVLKEIEKSVKMSQRRPLVLATIPTTREALKVVSKREFCHVDGGPPILKEVCVRVITKDNLD